MERVRDRLLRATAALERGGVEHAVVGGNAVAAWVSRVDEAAVRNTQDVDILLQRSDFAAATEALAAAGFTHRHAAGLDMFLDGDSPKARDAVHVVFAGERVRPDYAHPAPQISEAERGGSFHVVALDALVRMKLTSYRRKDQVHLLDLAGVGLIDESWYDRLPPDLATRLRDVLEHPDD